MAALAAFGISAALAPDACLVDQLQHPVLQCIAGRASDEHVRRLASEGARPRLPWAARVPALKADPTRAAPILEALKADSAIYVRKSVANHLNDIAKDRPDWLLDRLAEWPNDNPHTAWIIRHALRTLIKQGEPRALAVSALRGPPST